MPLKKRLKKWRLEVRRCIAKATRVKFIRRYSAGRLVTVDEVIGRGASCVVYQGNFSDEIVAVKRVPLKQTVIQKVFNLISNLEIHNYVSNVARVRGEVYRLSKCQHPNVLLYHDAFLYRHSIWIVTERCVGTLSSLCVKTDRYFNTFCSPIEVINFVFAPICRALKFIHSLNIAHLDLKPDNILLTKDLIPKIADFGLSVNIEYEMKANFLFGTPGYIAPEICRGLKYDGKADVWSLAKMYCTLMRGNWVPRLVDKTTEMRMLRRMDWDEEATDLAAHQVYKCAVSNANRNHYNHTQLEALDFLCSLLIVSPSRRLSSDELCKHSLVKKNLGIWDNNHDKEFSIKHKILKEHVYKKVFPLTAKELERVNRVSLYEGDEEDS